MNKICAISGSNGYVGGCVKKHFAARGWDILELARRPRPGFRAAQLELGGELSPDLLSGVTALIHCAYDFKPRRWDEIAEVNVEGSRKIFAAAREASILNVVFISSISAFEGCKSLYGRAKLEIEKIALASGALVVRPGLVYGNDSGGMFGRLAAQVRKSSIVPLIGGGAQIQHLVHEEDLSGFIERYARGENKIASRILTAANERPWPFKKLLLAIARAQDRKPTFIPLPWRPVWLGLKAAEWCGVKLDFRSDSLVSLMFQNPEPDFSANAGAGLNCRPFDIRQLKL